MYPTRSRPHGPGDGAGPWCRGPRSAQPRAWPSSVGAPAPRPVCSPVAPARPEVKTLEAASGLHHQSCGVVVLGPSASSHWSMQCEEKPRPTSSLSPSPALTESDIRSDNTLSCTAKQDGPRYVRLWVCTKTVPRAPQARKGRRKFCPERSRCSGTTGRTRQVVRHGSKQGGREPEGPGGGPWAPLEVTGAVRTWQGPPEGLGAQAGGPKVGGGAVSGGCPGSSGGAE